MPLPRVAMAQAVPPEVNSSTASSGVADTDTAADFLADIETACDADRCANNPRLVKRVT